jgi:hypothetical protein
MELKKVTYEGIEIDDDLIWFVEQLQELRNNHRKNAEAVCMRNADDGRKIILQDCKKIVKDNGCVTYYWLELANIICLAYLKSCKESNYNNLPKSEEGRHGIPPQA